jgi:hypothetical protein
MGELNEEKITALFDQLVSEDVLVYGPHKSIRCGAEGFPVSQAIKLVVACTWVTDSAYSSSSKSASI